MDGGGYREVSVSWWLEGGDRLGQKGEVTFGGRVTKGRVLAETADAEASDRCGDDDP